MTEIEIYDIGSAVKWHQSIKVYLNLVAYRHRSTCISSKTFIQIQIMAYVNINKYTSIYILTNVKLNQCNIHMVQSIHELLAVVPFARTNNY